MNMVKQTEKTLKFDNKDLSILKELQKDSSQNHNLLAKKLGLPLTTLIRRIRQLEKNNVIKQYTAVLNPDFLEQSAVAFALIKVQQQPLGKNKEGAIPDIMKKLAEHDEVQEVFSLAGDYDIIAKIRAKNQKELGNWLMRDFWKVPGISGSSSLITFNCGKETLKLKME